MAAASPPARGGRPRRARDRPPRGCTRQVCPAGRSSRLWSARPL